MYLNSVGAASEIFHNTRFLVGWYQSRVEEGQTSSTRGRVDTLRNSSIAMGFKFRKGAEAQWHL